MSTLSLGVAVACGGDAGDDPDAELATSGGTRSTSGGTGNLAGSSGGGRASGGAVSAPGGASSGGTPAPPGAGGRDASTGGGSAAAPSPGSGAASDSGGSPGASAGSSAAGGATAGEGTCDDGDRCPVESGVTWECKTRFMYGLNYAWQHFAGDFGGITQFNQPGVSANPEVESTLRSFAENGVSVVRWWMWPDFRGDGVQLDADGTPTGLGGTALADLEAALALAEEYDLYLMLTLFSFDNFAIDLAENRSLYPIARDAEKRAALVEEVVRPFARAAATSPHADRLIAWDVINEPEWAVRGASLYGDQAFDPQEDLDQITHEEMETFLREVIAGLRDESGALITVGGAALKWKNAWSQLDLDFYQFHIYDWVNTYWSYDQSPAEHGITDKPVVMGEFPPGGLERGSIGYRMLIDSWYGSGYAGALAWRDTSGQFNVDLSEVKAFADAHPCETRY